MQNKNLMNISIAYYFRVKMIIRLHNAMLFMTRECLHLYQSLESFFKMIRLFQRNYQSAGLDFFSTKMVVLRLIYIHISMKLLFKKQTVLGESNEIFLSFEK